MDIKSSVGFLTLKKDADPLETFLVTTSNDGTILSSCASDLYEVVFH